MTLHWIKSVELCDYTLHSNIHLNDIAHDATQQNDIQQYNTKKKLFSLIIISRMPINRMTFSLITESRMMRS
jgi:hypothetical protein